MLEALPCNLDVERLVLGLLMLDESLLHNTRPVLLPEDFLLEKHRRIFRRVTGLYDAGRHVDHVTVAQALLEAGELESRDGVAYLIGLQEGVPLQPDLSSYLRILKDEAARRHIIAVANSAIHRAANHDNPQVILDSLRGITTGLVSPGSGKGLVSARELVDRVGISEILAPRIARGVPFPWEWLTDATCGMLPGELWVLAAHTSAGKTSAAIETAVHVARTQSKAVAVFSLEMGDVSVLQRAVWQLSRVDSERAKRGMLTPEETKRAAKAVSALYELPLHFDDGSLSVMEIHARLRSQRAHGPIGLVVVDYLQLLRDGRHNTRAEAVGANTRALKLMASEFECPVLLLSQFNRESAKAKDNKESKVPRRPELHDLKESGDIENHANGVWFIHRPDQRDAAQVSVEFILPKQRDGRRNVSRQFWFFPAFQAFNAKEDHADAA